MNRPASPADLIQARAAASRDEDFGFIYDSYLEGANFRRQFPRRQEYLDFARENLAGAVLLQECRVLRVRADHDAAEVLFYQHFVVRGVAAETLEWAHLKRTPAGWRFDYSERLERTAVAKALEEIDWDDFARSADRVVF